MEKRVLSKPEVIKLAAANGHDLSWKRSADQYSTMVASATCTRCGAGASSVKTEDEAKLIIEVALRKPCKD